MTLEKVLKLAQLYGGLDAFDDFDTGGSVSMWVFSEEGVRKFVHAVIKADRERIKQIIDDVGRKGDHDKWFDCADAIAGRIEE